MQHDKHKKVIIKKNKKYKKYYCSVCDFASFYYFRQKMEYKSPLLLL